MTKYFQGSDGRACFESLFGKPVREESLEFGARVLWRRRRGPDYNVLDEALWEVGLWLGRFHRWRNVVWIQCCSDDAYGGHSTTRLLGSMAHISNHHHTTLYCISCNKLR